MMYANELIQISRPIRFLRTLNPMTITLIEHINTSLEYNARTYGNPKTEVNISSENLKNLAELKKILDINVDFSSLRVYYTMMGYHTDIKNVGSYTDELLTIEAKML